MLHSQALLGHASLEMVRYYAQVVNHDLLQDHQAHSPVDNLARLRHESAALRAFPDDSLPTHENSLDMTIGPGS